MPKLKPLKPHAMEMLRLIGRASTGSSYWYPQDRAQLAEDAAGVFEVIVGGAQTVGAITTLTARGYAEVIDGMPTCMATGQGIFARRITVAGRALLDEHLVPLIAARERERARRRALTSAERDAEDWTQ